MNSHPRPRANKFEILTAVVLSALALIFLGATSDFIYRLILAGWRAADFIFEIFSPRP